MDRRDQCAISTAGVACQMTPAFELVLHLEDSNGTDEEARTVVCGPHAAAALAWLAAQPRGIVGGREIEVDQLQRLHLPSETLRLTPRSEWWPASYDLATNGLRCPRCGAGVSVNDQVDEGEEPDPYACDRCLESVAQPLVVGQDDARIDERRVAVS